MFAVYVCMYVYLLWWLPHGVARGQLPAVAAHRFATQSSIIMETDLYYLLLHTYVNVYVYYF